MQKTSKANKNVYWSGAFFINRQTFHKRPTFFIITFSTILVLGINNSDVTTAIIFSISGPMCTSWGSTRPSTRSCMAVISIHELVKSREGLGKTGGWKIKYQLTMCTCSPESQFYPGLHKGNHGHQVKGDDSLPFLCSHESPSGMLCSGLHPQQQTAPELCKQIQVTKLITGVKNLSYEERSGMWMLQMGSQGESHVLTKFPYITRPATSLTSRHIFIRIYQEDFDAACMVSFR